MTSCLFIRDIQPFFFSPFSSSFILILSSTFFFIFILSSAPKEYSGDFYGKQIQNKLCNLISSQTNLPHERKLLKQKRQERGEKMWKDSPKNSSRREGWNKWVSTSFRTESNFTQNESSDSWIHSTDHYGLFLLFSLSIFFFSPNELFSSNYCLNRPIPSDAFVPRSIPVNFDTSQLQMVGFNKHTEGEGEWTQFSPTPSLW